MYILIKEILFILSCVLSLCHTQEDLLIATLSKAKLPTPRHHLATVYDGKDLIYIAGGYKGPEDIVFDEFLQYSISTDRITLLGRLPTTRYGGKLTMDGEGNIYYCGGRIYDDIIRYNSTNKEWAVVSQLPVNKAYSALLQHPYTQEVYLIGGIFDNGGITLFKMSSNLNSTIIYSDTNSMFGTDSSTVALIDSNVAVIFGNFDNEMTHLIRFHLSSLILDPFSNTFPNLKWPSSVNGGKFIYIVGGQGGDLLTPTDGILKVDPSSGNHTFLQVANFPAENDTRFLSTSSVYVENLKRIYIFGGANNDKSSSTSTRTSRDEIWWIDLDTEGTPTSTTTESLPSSTLNPDVFDCSNKPNGMYPHPYGCHLFVGCYSGMSAEYECPHPLLFDPYLLKTCTFPQDFQCEITCEGKEDAEGGMYKHPYDCSYFLGCHNGQLEIYKCPPPLLFDAEQQKCNFPEAVVCNV